MPAERFVGDKPVWRGIQDVEVSFALQGQRRPVPGGIGRLDESQMDRQVSHSGPDAHLPDTPRADRGEGHRVLPAIGDPLNSLVRAQSETPVWGA